MTWPILLDCLLNIAHLVLSSICFILSLFYIFIMIVLFGQNNFLNLGLNLELCSLAGECAAI